MINDIAPSERLRRLMIEVVPFKVGRVVTVSPTCQYASEWPGTYTIVGMSWDYQQGDGHGMNISIASDDEIVNRHGSTDGWRAEDLIPAQRS